MARRPRLIGPGWRDAWTDFTHLEQDLGFTLEQVFVDVVTVNPVADVDLPAVVVDHVLLFRPWWVVWLVLPWREQALRTGLHNTGWKLWDPARPIDWLSNPKGTLHPGRRRNTSGPDHVVVTKERGAPCLAAATATDCLRRSLRFASPEMVYVATHACSPKEKVLRYERADAVRRPRTRWTRQQPGGFGGNCVRCDHPLTDPVSLEAGYGPTCRRKLGIRPIPVHPAPDGPGAELYRVGARRHSDWQRGVRAMIERWDQETNRSAE